MDDCDRPVRAKGLCGSHYSQAYRQLKPDVVRAAERRYWEANKEKIRARRRKYQSAYRLRHPDAYRNWVAKNREKTAAYQHHRNNVKRAGSGEKIALADIAERDGGRCHICGRQVQAQDRSLDHLVPISAGGPHVRLNVALAHRRCNSRRGAGRIPAQLRLVG